MPTVTYTTPGIFHQFTVPAGVTSVTIEAIGKGGIGGNAVNINEDGTYAGMVQGGGGGGGGYGRVTQSVTFGQIIEIYIPTLANDPLINHVQVTFYNTTGLIMRVNPGTNGGIGAYINQFDFQTQGYGGPGGNAVLGNVIGTSNFVSYTGGTGAYGGAGPYSGGGGGGGAGTTSNGGNADGQSYGTGGSLYGGNGGNGAFFYANRNGAAGSNYGGGGGGAVANYDNSPYFGGSNGGAWAAITYTEPPPPAVGNGRFFPFF